MLSAPKHTRVVSLIEEPCPTHYRKEFLFFLYIKRYEAGNGHPDHPRPGCWFWEISPVVAAVARKRELLPEHRRFTGGADKAVEPCGV
jgi:hypothetical protein